MKDYAKTYFLVAWIVSIVMAVLYGITIAGLVLTIPLVIAFKKFKAAEKMSDTELVEHRRSLFGWGIFLSIVCAPTDIVIIALIVCSIVINNYIKDIEEGNAEKTEKSFSDTVVDSSKELWKNTKEAFATKPSLDKQKEELAKLDQMKNEGIITEEEYAAKRKKILDIEDK